MCDKCELWYHTNCIETELDYSAVKNISNFSWICFGCGFVNFDSSLFETRSISTSNPFSVLSEFDDSLTQNSHKGDYPCTSTPIKLSKNNSQLPPIKNRKKNLHGMNINVNGIKSVAKQAAFRAIIDQHKPDVIFGTESKINSKFATYEIFPEDYMYTVYRKDRDENGGGVFLATKDSLISSEEPDLGGDCEIIWASIQFSKIF